MVFFGCRFFVIDDWIYIQYYGIDNVEDERCV